MNRPVNVIANTTAYLEGMRKADRAMKRRRRTETAFALIAYLFIIGPVLMVSGAAW